MAPITITNIGIISCGEMGLGIARLLLAHGYNASTYAADRSKHTQETARSAGVELFDTFEAFVANADAILSIVPPRDAYATAQRFAEAVTKEEGGRERPLYYLDLNATSTKTAAKTAELLGSVEKIVLIDGGIIGGVPYPLTTSTATNGTNGVHDTSNAGRAAPWHCPALVVSGPTELPDPALAEVLRIDHISPAIGAATGVKMCFAATTKGFISLAIQSYTTAHQLGCLDTLRDYLAKYQPETHKLAEKGLVTMPPKAYRWVGEMKEIAETFESGGGFRPNL